MFADIQSSLEGEADMDDSLDTEDIPQEEYLGMPRLRFALNYVLGQLTSDEKTQLLTRLDREETIGQGRLGVDREVKRHMASKRGIDQTYGFMPPMIELCRMMGLKRCH